MFFQCQNHWFPKGNGDILNSINRIWGMNRNLISMNPKANVISRVVDFNTNRILISYDCRLKLNIHIMNVIFLQII